MRIGNPPPLTLTTIAVSAVASPSTIASITTISLSTATSTDIAAITNQQILTLCNVSSAGDLYLCGTDTTAGNTGILLGPRAIASLNVNATVRVTNNSGSTVSLTGIKQGT